MEIIKHFSNVPNQFNELSEKNNQLGNDFILIEDSSDNFKKKKTKIINLPDEKVKISSNDMGRDYLINKIVGESGNINITKIIDAENYEYLKIDIGENVVIQNQLENHINNNQLHLESNQNDALDSNPSLSGENPVADKNYVDQQDNNILNALNSHINNLDLHLEENQNGALDSNPSLSETNPVADKNFVLDNSNKIIKQFFIENFRIDTPNPTIYPLPDITYYLVSGTPNDPLVYELVASFDSNQREYLWAKFFLPFNIKNGNLLSFHFLGYNDTSSSGNIVLGIKLVSVLEESFFEGNSILKTQIFQVNGNYRYLQRFTISDTLENWGLVNGSNIRREIRFCIFRKSDDSNDTLPGDWSLSSLIISWE